MACQYRMMPALSISVAAPKTFRRIIGVFYYHTDSPSYGYISLETATQRTKGSEPVKIMGKAE